MNMNYILSLLPILVSTNYKLIEYNRLILLYMLVTTVYMFQLVYIIIVWVKTQRLY